MGSAYPFHAGIPLPSLGAPAEAFGNASVGAASVRPALAHASAAERWLAGLTASESASMCTTDDPLRMLDLDTELIEDALVR